LEAVARQGGLNAPDVALLNWILGRAHNNLGYAYWMVSEPSDLAEQCQAALREFRTALTYFEASGWLEGIANTRDNMGRVYTLLGQPDHAYDDVEEGLGLREGLGDAYRCALSYNSLAIAELRFGQPDYACQLAERALDIFEKQEAQRGIGLASTTLGRVFFRLARCALDQPLACELFLRQSIQHLERAIRIFERDVNEPVRLREAQGLVAQVRRLANLCGIVGFDERVN
jgi:tetratricopeptide (TPR) repeat protein